MPQPREHPLTAWRKRHKLTLDQAARLASKAAGVTISKYVVHRLEIGAVRRPTPSHIAALVAITEGEVGLAAFMPPPPKRRRHRPSGARVKPRKASHG